MQTVSKTFFIHTFGCQSNKSDSERIAGDYIARGFCEAASWENCDELVINTCAVRERVEDRARAFVHKVVAYFNAHSSQHPKIILTGCMVHHGNEKIYSMMPAIDQILPINEVGFNLSAIRKDKHHAWVPISVGCNSFCTYCIVPYSRGREKSRSFEDIMSEIRHLVAQGYSEITLLGMNVNSWGLEKVGIGFRKMMMSNADFQRQDLPSNQSQYLSPQGNPPFVKLLQAVSSFKQVKKIRFLSSNPWDFFDELIEEVAHNKKIDRYVHLPIQSGSNSVLYRMNRGYTVEQYETVVKKLRKADPNIVIGTDIIVGFPEETEEEFQQTVQLAKRMDWRIAFVAMYSPRPGTASWKMYQDTVSHAEKKKRWKILDTIINVNNLSQRPKIV